MRLFGLIKTTVLGGAIFLVPMIVIIVVVGKALQFSMKVAAPLAFEVERLDDGRVVVYLQGAPYPWSGAILVMTEDRIQSLPIKMVAAVQNLKMLGRGTRQILAQQRERNPQR